jgi:hypothetical protein
MQSSDHAPVRTMIDSAVRGYGFSARQYVKRVRIDAANAMRTLETMCATNVQPERVGSTRIMWKLFSLAASCIAVAMQEEFLRDGTRSGFRPTSE